MNITSWKKIYSTSFFDAPQCWTTCDGYCCKNFFGNYFTIFNKDSVVLPMFEDEYLYYESIGGIKNIPKATKHTFELNSKEKFSVYFTKCNAKGMCDPHCARPLICRIYPYFPIVNVKGEIIDFEYAAFMDLFYENKLNHPCTLVREQSAQIKQQIQNSFQESLKENPKLIFTFKLLELLALFVKNHFPIHLDKLSEEEKKTFFKNYEITMLKGTIWKKEEFKNKVLQTYIQIKNHYGNFL